MRDRKLSDSEAKARFFHEVADAHLSKVINVALKSDLFTYDIAARPTCLLAAMNTKKPVPGTQLSLLQWKFLSSF